ncbi:MAG: hypothetical protein FWD26_10230 [Treponema sp.]|nr:hypothetical protein [Treponema sp.]
MKKTAILLLLPFLVLVQITADVKTDRELVLQISTLPEAKLGFTQNFIFPFLQGDSPLTQGNNIKLSFTTEATPVSMNAIFNTVLTPIAFLEFSAGGRIGAGWPVNMFGGDIYGTGLNLPDVFGYSTYVNNAGLLWKAHIGGTFQFDLAAVFPGDWNSVVFLTYHEINYHGNTAAKAGQGWYYEDDDGENCNGFNYYGNFLIGYQMPIFLDLVAFLVEMELYLYDTPGRSVWGDDRIRWTFSNILHFSITEQFGIAIITQLRTRRNFINYDERDKNAPVVHYQNRILNTLNPQRLEFYRVAAAISYRF